MKRSFLFGIGIGLLTIGACDWDEVTPPEAAPTFRILEPEVVRYVGLQAENRVRVCTTATGATMTASIDDAGVLLSPTATVVEASQDCADVHDGGGPFPSEAVFFWRGSNDVVAWTFGFPPAGPSTTELLKMEGTSTCAAATAVSTWTDLVDSADAGANDGDAAGADDGSVAASVARTRVDALVRIVRPTDCAAPDAGATRISFAHVDVTLTGAAEEPSLTFTTDVNGVGTFRAHLPVRASSLSAYLLVDGVATAPLTLTRP